MVVGPVSSGQATKFTRDDACRRPCKQFVLDGVVYAQHNRIAPLLGVWPLLTCQSTVHAALAALGHHEVSAPSLAPFESNATP